MPVSAVDLPFREQAEFFRRKLNLPTEAWTDIYSREHDWAFVVAGANRDALVSDFRTAVEKVVANGGTLQDFRRDFDEIVARHGWSYNGGRNWRSRVIYETNLNSSYMAGRYQQLLAVREDRPYWQYLHSDAVEQPRPHHEAWHGMILRWDDPWWQYHFPPGGWGCQCRVIALSEADLVRMGRTVDTAPPIEWEDREIGQRSPGGPRTVRVPQGIDPGFEHIPGRSRLDSAVPPERPTPLIRGSAGGPGVPNLRPLDALPPPRVSPVGLLPDGLSGEEYAEMFLNEFGATLQQPGTFTDAIGERLVIGRELFTTRRTGELKADKAGRGKYMRILAQALREPDEIYARMEWHEAQSKAVVRRRYVTQLLLPDGDETALAVFELGPDGWTGVTTFSPRDMDINDLRVGVRLYRRED